MKASWKFWIGRLLRGYFIMALSCVITFPIAMYLVVPFVVSIATGSSYQAPTEADAMKWVRYGVLATIWVGSVGWLSEFIPWLIKAIRARRNGDAI